MSEPTHIHPSDLHGALRLAADATGAVTDIVEAMHEAIAWPPLLSRRSPTGRAGGIPGLAYSGVRTAARWVGSGIDLALSPLVPLLGEKASTPQRDALLSVVSGVIGDHLDATGNPLAVRMELRRRGRALELRRGALARDLPRTSSRIVVFVHGLCGTDAQWKRAAFDYGLAVERDRGFTPLYLRYNSGLHVSTNGLLLARLLEKLVHEWPVDADELAIVGHSMGGLVARSAVRQAEAACHRWPSRLRRIAFLGTPHHGAPLERGGHWFEEVLGTVRYAAPLSRLGRLRSAGITDLRHGSIVEEDWNGADRFAHAHDTRVPSPLPDGVDCLAIAATAGANLGDARDRLVGDGLVPVASALGLHDDPAKDLAFEDSRRHVVYRMHHLELLGDPEVYAHLSHWLAG